MVCAYTGSTPNLHNVAADAKATQDQAESVWWSTTQAKLFTEKATIVAVTCARMQANRACLGSYAH